MNVVSSRPGFYRHGYHLGVTPRGFYDRALGQDGTILSPYQTYGSPDSAPDAGILTPVQPEYGTTSTQGFPDYGATAPQNAPAPSVSVPPSQILSPYQTYGSIYNQPNTVSSSGTLPPGPSPRVNVPLAPSSVGMFLTNSSLITGVPNWIVLGGGLLAIPLLGSLVGGGGGRRRRR